MNYLHIKSIQEDLYRIIESTDYFFDTRPIEKFPSKYKVPSMLQFTKLGYVTFVLRFRSNALSVFTLLENVNKSNWSLYQHSISIINRSSLLDCLYVMAWEKDKNFIKQLLADSFENLEKNKHWKFSDLQKENLNGIRNLFCNTKIDIGPKRLLEIVGESARPVYLLYDLYSKSDHFSVLDSMIFKMKVEDQMDLLEQATKVISQILNALYLTFEKDVIVKHILIQKLATNTTFFKDL